MSELFSFDAECALLGGVFRNPESFDEISEVVSEKDFYFPQNKSVFSLMTGLSLAGSEIDAITVAEAAKAEQQDAILSHVIENLANGWTANHKAISTLIKSYSVRRQIINASREVLEYAEKNSDATACTDFAQRTLIDIDDNSESTVRPSNINECLKGYIADLEHRLHSDDTLRGLSSGIERIDYYTNGYRKNHLVLVCGRPSMGKTTLALQKAAYMSVTEKKRGFIFSLEMSRDELMEKLIACVGKIDLDLLQSPKNIGARNEDFWPKLANTATMIKDSPINLLECPGINIHQLKSYARKAHRRNPLDYIMVDHIHIMGGKDNTEERISEISTGLKTLAGELKIPVIALAQLNRKVEERSNKEPIMSDLRGSGSLEQDADVIEFIYRPDYYNEDSINKGLVQVEIAKHRNGKRGKVTLENIYSQSRLGPTSLFIQSEKQGSVASIRNSL